LELIGYDQREPRDAEREPHANQNGWQRARKDHLAKQPARVSNRIRTHPDEVFVHDRSGKNAECDQVQLGPLIDAEPKNEQWDESQMRHISDHPERAIEQSRRCESLPAKAVAGKSGGSTARNSERIGTHYPIASIGYFQYLSTISPCYQIRVVDCCPCLSTSEETV
jgi:hypothetical protein